MRVQSNDPPTNQAVRCRFQWLAWTLRVPASNWFGTEMQGRFAAWADAVHASDRRGRVCSALPFIGSGRQVVQLQEHVQNDRTQHHESYDFHGNPPWCADLARREDWTCNVAARRQLGLVEMNCDKTHIVCDECRTRRTSLARHAVRVLNRCGARAGASPYQR